MNSSSSLPEIQISSNDSISQSRRMSVTSQDSDKSLKSVSFNDQVTFRSYQPNFSIPLERERSIELVGDLDQSAKELSKLVPYKKSNSIKRAFKSLFKSKTNEQPAAIVL